MADGVFFAELNELLTRELAEDGYSGVEVRVTPLKTEIIIRATRTQNVLGAPPAPPSRRRPPEGEPLRGRARARRIPLPRLTRPPCARPAQARRAAASAS